MTNSERGDVLIGGGRYALVGEGAAELAFVTGEKHRGLGVAAAVMKHLIQIARAKGVKRFEAEVLAQNQPMLAAFRRSGLPVEGRREGAVVL
jgi:RimJ/RimL family protein N-acetyltransferase